MAKFCLTADTKRKFIQALRTRDIDPAKLSEMTSTERRAFLERYVGKENGVQVNSLFESKLLLKNQKAGYISWAKKVSGLSPQAKRDLISRIERMDKVLNPTEERAFLHDLAQTRLGFGVSETEAKAIADLSQKVVDTRNKIPENAKLRSPERMKYGLSQELLKDYVSKLKADANKISFREQPIKKTTHFLWNYIPDLAQTLQTSYDNSIWGRQLVTTLFNPRYSLTWTKNFLRSWKDIGVALKGGDPILAVKADINSRPNALNGKYAADPQGYGLGISSEETYSVHFPARIPVLGRLFKASEAAFNGGALRVRADLADMHIGMAERAGKNVLDKKFAAGLGNFVTSITGRASIQGEGWARSFFYAPRMYLADIHQLTAHFLDSKADAYVRKQAIKNLTYTLVAYSAFFTTAKMVDPGSVDTNKHLGQIKVFGNWVDMTGGRVSFVNLTAKMGQKIYESSQGKTPGYGEDTGWDLLLNFASNKASPKLAVVIDILRGSMYGGKKVTLENELVNRFTPLTKQDIDKILNDPKSTNKLALSIISGNGFSISHDTPKAKDWSMNPTKTLTQFKGKVGDAKFKEANDRYNQQYNSWYQKVSESSSYKNLSPDEQLDLNIKAKEAIQSKILKSYHFKYKTQKADKAATKKIKQLLP